jgi:hypothetical protein
MSRLRLGMFIALVLVANLLVDYLALNYLLPNFP